MDRLITNEQGFMYPATEGSGCENESKIREIILAIERASLNCQKTWFQHVQAKSRACEELNGVSGRMLDQKVRFEDALYVCKREAPVVWDMPIVWKPDQEWCPAFDGCFGTPTDASTDRSRCHIIP